MRKKQSKGYIIIYACLTLGAIIMVFPFIWSILTSFKTLTESLTFPPKFFPDQWNLNNYKDVWQALPFPKFFFNTVVMMVARVITSTIFSAMAGYAFARIQVRGMNLLFLLVLLPMMVPGQVFILPQYLLISKAGLTNTLLALVIPGIASTFGTFLMRQFFMSVPEEIEEAAILDGCNYGQIFIKIMLPLAKAPLVSLAIFTALFAWKDLMWPLIVNMSPDKMPLSSGLALLQGQYTTNYPQLMAGAVLATIPMLILYLIFQKQFIQGVASTGSKN
ncbi:multiple sugar transport system permease protein [Enterococcus sp. PF1-24]|uniref:carbohydrate ABC transporter permease n=1 Tax=unclassified Enterococcus TaxID=2608891 RepID=UPI002474F510|nr:MULTISPECIES: carbohydrate ABC transporter permease [unclassified Enterococcus]MDH6364280.1 multiple sugar transport system permease protein [Enterococcus sp. PFB1-1]MDH6401361.1 multiple sugar transport system permease protein [Enterococcus sp. PF1-24]